MPPLSTKICNKCKLQKPIDEFYKRITGAIFSNCKDCQAKIQKEYRSSEKGKLAYKKKHLKEKYNITLDGHKKLYIAQNGYCLICKELIPYSEMVTDHNHETGKVRGLLCGRCNRLLGYIEKTPDTAKSCFDYLERTG